MSTGVVVDFNANLARFSSGVDKAINDLNKFESQGKRVSAAINSAFATLGVGLSIAGFTAMIKGSIDAQDRLNDLRLTTNLTIETLSGLDFAAAVSGSDLEATAASINKLAVNMGKNAEKFKALGITAKDPLEAFKQLAEIFVTVQDPQLRAALGAEALGKTWQGAAPLLMEGSKGIAALVEKGARLAGMTTESTKAADEFNDKWRELFGTGRLLNTMVGDALPLLNALADDMIKARDKSGDLNDEFKPLLETGKAVTILFGNVAFVMKAVGTEIGGIAAQFAALGKGEFAKAWAIGDIMKADAEAARKAFDEWETKILGLGGRAAAAGAEAVKKRDAALESRVSKFVDPGKTAKLVGSVEDYALRIQQAVAGAVHNSAIVKARELADQIEFLDSLFFDSGLDADIYTSALEKLTGMTDNAAKAAERLAHMIDATPSAQLEEARKDMQLLAEAFERGRISEEQFNEAVQTRLGQTGKALDEMTEFAREAARNMQDAMADGFFDLMQGKFDRLGSNFKTMIDRMVANAVAADLAKRLFGDFGKTGEMGGWIGGLLKGLGGGGGYGDAAGVAAGVPQFAAGTPYVQRTGLALIHQGERIVPAAENRAGFGGNITINISGSNNAPDVRRAAGQGAREALAAFSGAQRYG